MGLLSFPAIPEISRCGIAGFSRDSRSPYRGRETGNGTGTTSNLKGLSHD